MLSRISRSQVRKFSSILILESLDYLAVGHKCRIPVRPLAHLQTTLREHLFGNDKPNRNADELCIGELLSRADVAFVVENIDIVLAQKLVRAVGFRRDVLIAAGDSDEVAANGATSLGHTIPFS